MQFVKLEKKEEGKFITRYDLTYRLNDGEEKVYEIISRDRNVSSLADLQKRAADSVVLIMEDETGERILLGREFRLAVGEWVYNFPAGLIDRGETPEEAAARELLEETGLSIIRITDTLGGGYGAVSFSNELNICVFGVAAGTLKESSFAEEEIVPGWFTREQVRELLRKEKFAARTQAYCYAWSHSAAVSADH